VQAVAKKHSLNIGKHNEETWKNTKK
jgi:hypothetical protein